MTNQRGTGSRVSALVSHLSSEAGVENVSVNHTASSFVTNLPAVFGKVGSTSDDDVVVVSALRTPIGRAKKGSFKNTTPDDLLLAAFNGVIKQTKLDPKVINDIVVGNVQTSGAYSMPARSAMFRAGFPETTCIRSVNRQCSSGLQAVASIASDIKAGFIDVGIGAGVESMTHGGNPSDPSALPPMNLNEIFQHPLAKDCLTPMGITSETVAARYGVTREDQDKFATSSHTKALKAQKTNRFKEEIVPVKVTIENDGKEQQVTVDKDDGPREGTTVENLMKLRPAFKKDGSTTAGNASQVSDGAAAVIMMKRKKAKELGLPVLGVFRGFKVSGVKPDEMGVGPAYAIPDLLDSAGIKVSDVDIYEINEAFASQAVYCVKKLGIDEKKVNVNGGAIALGHPLGMTGARQVATILHEMQKVKKEKGKGNLVGVVSMCIGTGMGAAGLFEVQ